MTRKRTLYHHQHQPLSDIYFLSFLSPALHKSQWGQFADKEVGLEIRRSSDMNLNTLVLCVRSLRCLRSPAESSGPFCCFVDESTQMNISHLLTYSLVVVLVEAESNALSKKLFIFPTSEKRLNHRDQKPQSDIITVPH